MQTAIARCAGVAIVVAVGIALAGITAPRARAQGLTIEIAPGKINRVVQPGETITQTFRIGNYSERTQTLSLYVRDFRVGAADGTPIFSEEGGFTDPAARAYALSRWVHLPVERITIPAGKTQTVDVTITVPEDADPGGHYGAFFAQTEDPLAQADTQGSVVGAVGRIAALMLITVPGKVLYRVTLQDFRSDRFLYWTSEPTVRLMATLANEGNVHAIPTGAIFISGGIGYRTQTIPFNAMQAAVLPTAPPRRIVDTVRMRRSSIIPPFGHFRADLIGRYANGQQIQASVTFFVIPVKFLAIVFGSVFLLLFIVHRALVSFRAGGAV